MTFSIMSNMRINLMFSGGMDVVLKYRIVPNIVNNSLLKRTMKAVKLRRFVTCESARRKMVFKIQYICLQKILTSWGL